MAMAAVGLQDKEDVADTAEIADEPVSLVDASTVSVDVEVLAEQDQKVFFEDPNEDRTQKLKAAEELKAAIRNSLANKPLVPPRPAHSEALVSLCLCVQRLAKEENSTFAELLKVLPRLGEDVLGPLLGTRGAQAVAADASLETKRHTGVVKSYNLRKGFGFIDLPGFNRDIFVYNAHLIGRLGLVAGEAVEFQLISQDGRPQARNVKVLPTSAVNKVDLFASLGGKGGAATKSMGAENPLKSMKQAMAPSSSQWPPSGSIHDLALAMAAAAAEVPTTLPQTGSATEGRGANHGSDGGLESQDLARKIREAQTMAASDKRKPTGKAPSHLVQQAHEAAQARTAYEAWNAGIPQQPPGGVGLDAETRFVDVGNIPTGASVKVVNFPATEVNNSTGTVQGFDAASQRYSVAVEIKKNAGQGTTTWLQLKEEYLQLKGGEASPPPLPGGASQSTALRKSASDALRKFNIGRSPIPMPAAAAGWLGANADAPAAKGGPAFPGTLDHGYRPPGALQSGPAGNFSMVNSMQGMGSQAGPGDNGSSRQVPGMGQMAGRQGPGGPHHGSQMHMEQGNSQRDHEGNSMMSSSQRPGPMQQARPLIPPSAIPLGGAGGMGKGRPPWTGNNPPTGNPLEHWASQLQGQRPMGPGSGPLGSGPGRPGPPGPGPGGGPPGNQQPAFPQLQPQGGECHGHGDFRSISDPSEPSEGYKGQTWRVLVSTDFRDVIVRKSFEVSSPVLKHIKPTEECTQRGPTVRTSTGLVRMPVEPDGWVTVHARAIKGPTFLEESGPPGPQPPQYPKHTPQSKQPIGQSPQQSQRQQRVVTPQQWEGSRPGQEVYGSFDAGGRGHSLRPGMLDRSNRGGMNFPGSMDGPMERDSRRDPDDDPWSRLEEDPWLRSSGGGAALRSPPTEARGLRAAESNSRRIASLTGMEMQRQGPIYSREDMLRVQAHVKDTQGQPEASAIRMLHIPAVEVSSRSSYDRRHRDRRERDAEDEPSGGASSQPIGAPLIPQDATVASISNVGAAGIDAKAASTEGESVQPGPEQKKDANCPTQ
mmetsp:Transcript_36642/g.80290  ORF Transcript_36642/g.80290 Transcript_36642/m.80290 type:complete len:1045 (-) Transcript_36642:149-3283(-)